MPTGQALSPPCRAELLAVGRAEIAALERREPGLRLGAPRLDDEALLACRGPVWGDCGRVDPQGVWHEAFDPGVYVIQVFFVEELEETADQLPYRFQLDLLVDASGGQCEVLDRELGGNY